MVGVVCAILGFLFGIYTVIRKIVDPHIAMGYSSTIALILFVGGIIMMMLGFLGEYIGRIYMTVSSAPQYAVRTRLNAPETEGRQ